MTFSVPYEPMCPPVIFDPSKTGILQWYLRRVEKMPGLGSGVVIESDPYGDASHKRSGFIRMLPDVKGMDDITPELLESLRKEFNN